VSISLGCSGELDTDIVRAERLNFLRRADAVTLAAANDEVGRMLHGLFNALDLKIRNLRPLTSTRA
jgi:hypothetical protein